LHGDVYTERCTGCGYDFERNFHVRQDNIHVHDHKFGVCERCGSAPPANYKGTPGNVEMKKSKWGGRMIGTNEKNCGTKDTHINFGEYLDPMDWNEADENCKKADLCIIAGTSMSLRHITHFPFLAKKTVLINLQATPDDNVAHLRIWAKCDPVFEGLMERLNIPIDPIPVWKPRDAVPTSKIPSLVNPYYIKKAKELESFYQQLENEYKDQAERDVTSDLIKINLNEKPSTSHIQPMLNLPDQVIIGNTHESINTNDENKHKWVMYVKSPDVDLQSYIENVEFKLHPTFSPPSLTVTKPPYSISRLGWGTFTIKVIITWKPQFHQPQLLHTHELSFSAPDTFNIIKIN